MQAELSAMHKCQPSESSEPLQPWPPTSTKTWPSASNLYLYVFSPALGLQQYSCQPDLQVWGSGRPQSENASQKSRKGNQTRLAVGLLGKARCSSLFGSVNSQCHFPQGWLGSPHLALSNPPCPSPEYLKLWVRKLMHSPGKGREGIHKGPWV